MFGHFTTLCMKGLKRYFEGSLVTIIALAFDHIITKYKNYIGGLH